MLEPVAIESPQDHGLAAQCEPTTLRYMGLEAFWSAINQAALEGEVGLFRSTTIPPQTV